LTQPQSHLTVDSAQDAGSIPAAFRQTVRVEVIDVDRYRPEVGRICLGDRFINMEMVRDGFAWRYVQFDKPREFTPPEADAREHQRGLWADPNPKPWEWRRAKRLGVPK